MARRRAQSEGAGPQSQSPPINSKSQELLDSVNALAYGVNSLAEVLPEFVDKLEVVTQQFAVLIAAEAERRHQTADQLASQMLSGLAEKVFRRVGGR